MRIDKLTSKLQSALADAQSMALVKEHNLIDSAHLMLALIDQKGGSVRPLLSQTGFNVPESVSYTHLTLPTNREV